MDLKLKVRINLFRDRGYIDKKILSILKNKGR